MPMPVEDDTTMSDTDAEEIKRKISLCSSLLTGEVNGFHDDVIDTPGQPTSCYRLSRLCALLTTRNCHA